MASVAEVRRQYERYPYPHVPIFGAVRRRDTWQLAADFLFDRSGMGEAPAKPRIWIAGCGTMQPYVFRLANPDADILATDLSTRSLRIAAQRCAWHGQYGVGFSHADLSDPSSLPDGPFDVIECYGVLMNLEDPAGALRALAARLAERGVLRVMVYPHYGRRRVFQIQRLAKLCGLRFDDPSHPALLRRLVHALPESHPLRYAFDNYTDARNDAGLVDGFLHAGDRGFTGMEFGALCASAGLRPGFWFHRPWARPDVMAERLHLEHTSQSFVLHYLDLWQELRGNFVACLVHDDAPQVTASRVRPHPMFARPRSLVLPRHGEWIAQRLVGVGLRTRLDDEGHRLRARDVRRLATLARHPERDPATVEDPRARGSLLGGTHDATTLVPHGGATIERPPGSHLAVGDLVPNPFYAHLFDAWTTGPEQTQGALPDVETQIATWRPIADRLECPRRPRGLTPFGSWAAFTETEAELRRSESRTAASFGDWPLRAALVDDARRRVAACGIPGVNELSTDALRELWTLLCSHEHVVLRDAFD